MNDELMKEVVNLQRTLNELVSEVRAMAKTAEDNRARLKAIQIVVESMASGT